MVSRKKDPRRPDSWLSQGYGFVSYVRRKHAKKALKELQQAALDGHALELKVSNRTTASVEMRVTGWPDSWLIGQTGNGGAGYQQLTHGPAVSPNTERIVRFNFAVRIII